MNLNLVGRDLGVVYPYLNKKSRTEESTVQNASGSFRAEVEKRRSSKAVVSATDNFKKKHPDKAAVVDNQIRAGKNVLKKNGVEDLSREDMTMEEYKRFFTDLMNSIPYDWSQQRDVNVWSITEKGWEQMKNDPDYEAWVLGYTAQDRAVNIPFAALPGYSPSYHTEHFGASIEEHLGQGFPMNRPEKKKSSSKEEESWWVKRQRRFEEIIEEQTKEQLKATMQRNINQISSLIG